MAIFIETDIYGSFVDGIARILKDIEPRKLAAALLKMERCGSTGDYARDQVIIALGEHCDVWPENLLPYAECAQVIPIGQR